MTGDRPVVKTLVLALEKTHSCQIDPLCTFLHLHAGLRKQIPCPISPFFSQVFSRITASSSGVTESEKYSWQNQRNMVHRIGLRRNIFSKYEKFIKEKQIDRGVHNFSGILPKRCLVTRNVTESEKYSWQNQRNMASRIEEMPFQNMTNTCDKICMRKLFSWITATSREMSPSRLFRLLFARCPSSSPPSQSSSNWHLSHLSGEMSPPANLKTQLGEKSKKHLSLLSREICSPLHSFLEIQIKTACVLDFASKINLIC